MPSMRNPCNAGNRQPPPGLVSRARALHANTKKWCSRGARDACDLRRVAAAAGRFDGILVHGFEHRAQ
eukprot:7886541-Lingulodinium_polyedra.AAC.1